ncbi:MAG: tocopherol cyclase family protein, partial [Clostridiales bacterium]
RRIQWMNNFHGKNKKRSYFEGWYLKNQNHQQTIAFIPAYHIDDQGRASASIQVITDQAAYNFTFPAHKFKAAQNIFYAEIDGNIFSKNGIDVDLHNEEAEIKGKLSYGDFLPLKYNIMGPFAFFSFLQCNHDVLSMDHEVFGSLTVNGEEISFHGDRGYIEKDWGSSFPNDYLWTQCNSFWDRPSSVMISVADIPFMGFNFTGCIASVRHRSKEYRLATYAGAKIEKYGEDEVIIHQGKYSLQASLLSSAAHALAAPQAGKMSRTIYEHPACQMRYRFWENKRIIFDYCSHQAGFEYCPGQSL